MKFETKFIIFHDESFLIFPFEIGHFPKLQQEGVAGQLVQALLHLIDIIGNPFEVRRRSPRCISTKMGLCSRTDLRSFR